MAKNHYNEKISNKFDKKSNTLRTQRDNLIRSNKKSSEVYLSEGEQYLSKGKTKL